MSITQTKIRSNWVRTLAKFLLRVSGWRTQVIPPHTSSYVLIGAPHTTNWDFLLALVLIIVEGIPMRIMGKDTLFRWPLGIFMRSIGAIPVNRRERTSMVDQLAQKFSQDPDLVIAIAPEGTRSKVHYWRSGFYYIALKANVPIVMGYLDHGTKTVGLGPSLKPTGDINADFEVIREFYRDKIGKYPHKQGPIELAKS
jgi:1-acyl-sn-glycerol-3-phosphate acyltransferase